MYKSKNKKTSTKNKKILILLAAVLLSAVLLLLVLEKTGVTNFYSKDEPAQDTGAQDSIDYTPPTEEELQVSEDEKVKNIDNAPTTEKAEEKVIIEEAYYDESAAELVVKTKLMGLNWSTCELIVSGPDQEITKTAKSIYQPEYSSCLGFGIDRSEFKKSGEWTILLRATTVDGATSSSEAKKVTISP